MEHEMWAEFDRACRAMLAKVLALAGVVASCGIVIWVVLR